MWLELKWTSIQNDNNVLFVTQVNINFIVLVLKLIIIKCISQVIDGI